MLIVDIDYEGVFILKNIPYEMVYPKGCSTANYCPLFKLVKDKYNIDLTKYDWNIYGYDEPIIKDYGET